MTAGRNATIADILPSVAAVLGAPGGEDRLGLRERLAGIGQVVVLLVDGMGTHLLPAMAPHAPLLASVLGGRTGRLDQLDCTFPSTTPTSLVSFGTGVDPGEHGVVGFTVNVPGTDRLLTHILWGDDPPPRQWQPVPTWFDRLAAAGTASTVVLPAEFEGRGLTESAYGGARFRPVRRDEDYPTALVDAIGDGTPLVFGYDAALDSAAHGYGIASDAWARAASHVDALLARVAEDLPPGTALLVTADHGGLDVPESARIDLADVPGLGDGVRVLAGEPRVRYLHTVPGAAEDVHATWTALLAGRAEVLLREEAVAAGLYGPVRPEHLDRIGDVVVICTGDTAVFASDREPPDRTRLIGFHGGRTAAEMAIPLITLCR